MTQGYAHAATSTGGHCQRLPPPFCGIARNGHLSAAWIALVLAMLPALAAASGCYFCRRWRP